MVISNRVVPKDHGALSALRELGQLLIGRPDVAERLSNFVDVGTPWFRSEVDLLATNSTGDFVVRYEASDALKEFIAAVRAPNRKLDEANSHAGIVSAHLPLSSI
jgi:hypothetical protein